MVDDDNSRTSTCKLDHAHWAPTEGESVVTDVPRAVVCSQATLAHIVDAMQAALPCEGVAVLGGVRRAAMLHITRAVPVHNQLGTSDRFAIAPEAFAVAAASLSPAAVQGFAHSHPGAQPEPSATDHRELWHHCLHAIASDISGIWTVRWFWRTAAGFLPLPCLTAEP
jgi:proteasome lid subunit RPN8/RPN11